MNSLIIFYDNFNDKNNSSFTRHYVSFNLIEQRKDEICLNYYERYARQFRLAFLPLNKREKKQKNKGLKKRRIYIDRPERAA